MNVTVQDLFAKIGQLTMENEALKALISDMRKEDDNVQTEVPSTVPGPDNDARLE